jgi:hypothetical protein
VSIRGTFRQTFSGPPELRAAAAEALSAARFALAEPEYLYPDDPFENSLGWITVESHEGNDDQPSHEFQTACLQRASDAVTPYGYRIRMHGIVMTGSNDWLEVVHRPTGRFVAWISAGVQALPVEQRGGVLRLLPGH